MTRTEKKFKKYKNRAINAGFSSHVHHQDKKVILPIGHCIYINSDSVFNEKGVKEIAIYGLGSCIALILRDHENKMSGMSHILLPSHEKQSGAMIKFPHKFADLSVKELLEKLMQMGADKNKIKAIIIGGANIFNNPNFAIGTENLKVVRKKLQELNIRIFREMVGGNVGRVVEYDLDKNEIRVRRSGTKEVQIINLNESYPCRNVNRTTVQNLDRPEVQIGEVGDSR
ncbi:MAG: hypothetical protein ACTSRW_14100 [Candidatus Helarchaeota archaeon]